MTETEFIAALRALPLHPGAHGLLDDAALLGASDGTLVLSTDTMVEHVHFAANLPPADIAWRLLAAALSDLAAKGARPEGVLLSITLAGDEEDAALVGGLDAALRHFGCPLLGGDTVRRAAPGAPRVHGCTAIGRATHLPVPLRTGARAGDALWVTGTIGAALLGFEVPDTAPNAYRRPEPLIAQGIALAPLVPAMMDVSDGLLLDAARMAGASGLAVAIALDRIPVPPALAGEVIRAATWGDDYQLLFALAADAAPPVPATRIGAFSAGTGLSLTHAGRSVPLPDRLGYLHGG